MSVGTEELIKSASAHPWWYSDQGMALNLIHELRAQGERIQVLEAEIKRLTTVTVKEAEGG